MVMKDPRQLPSASSTLRVPGLLRVHGGEGGQSGAFVSCDELISLARRFQQEQDFLGEPASLL
eukprot:750596-Hanusia_phi.AAC.3